MSNAFVEGMSNVLTPASARIVLPPTPTLESEPARATPAPAARVAPSQDAAAAANPELAPSSWEDFRGATGASEVPSTIAELEQYRRMRRGKTAEGKPFPRVELSKLPGDPRVPPSVGKLMHGIDALLPELMKEKGLTLDRLFELSLPRAERGHANRWQKTLAGAGAITAGAVAMQLAQAIVDPTSAAVAAGSFLIGQKLAGAVSYVVHDLIDEYDFMKDAFEFQVHHEDPGELGRWDFSNTVANIGQLTVPAMGILAAVAPTLGLAPGAAAFAFVGALWLAPAMHKVTHLPRQRPLAEDATPLERWKHKLEGVQRKAIELAQQIGLMPSKERHLEHHAGRRTGRMEGEKTLAHTESFDVSSGSLGVDVNQLFNDLEVSQRLKRTIYTTTKALHELTGGRTPPALEPHSWTEHPELKVLWGTEGTMAERREAYRQLRIERQTGTIADTQAQLDAARATVAAAPPGPDSSEVKVARVLMDNLPTRLRRMNAQLEVFKDPSKGKPLETRYEMERNNAQEAERALAKAAERRPDEATLRGLTEARDAAKAKFEEARQALLDVAPLLRVGVG
jgi:hypothetical protein